VCRPKHVEQLRNIGIINPTTRSHFVGSFYEIYVRMDGSMNIRLTAHSRVPAYNFKSPLNAPNPQNLLLESEFEYSFSVAPVICRVLRN
jgi:hypothetical protein